MIKSTRKGKQAKAGLLAFFQSALLKWPRHPFICDIPSKIKKKKKNYKCFLPNVIFLTKLFYKLLSYAVKF